MMDNSVKIKSFTLAEGYGKVLMLRDNEDTDVLSLFYHPGMDAPESQLAPYLMDGKIVKLDANNTLLTLVLPGTYQLRSVRPLSDNVNIALTDGIGFPVKLTVGIKNVVG